MVPGKHCDAGKDFYLAEHSSLRGEIQWLLEDYRSLERNVLVAVGVSCGWLLLNNDKVPRWTWFTPFLFAVLGAIRATGILRSFKTFGQYLAKIEEVFSADGDPGGWQHFLALQGKNLGTSRAAPAFWAVLLLFTLLVACVELKRHSVMPSPSHFLP